MSTKAPGPLFIVPDQPVGSYSEQFESYYECLHRAVTQSIEIPESIDSIIGLVRQLKNYYYWMREELEADHGISRQVAEALPSPEIAGLLLKLSEWEADLVYAQCEYDRRNNQLKASPLYSDPTDQFSGAVDCWKQYRLWMFEATRMLRVASERIADNAPITEPRKYPWV